VLEGTLAALRTPVLLRKRGTRAGRDGSIAHRGRSWECTGYS
jgi:hypothetical protein